MRIASRTLSLVLFSKRCHSFTASLSGSRRSVSFHGRVSLRKPATAKLSPSGTHAIGEIPPDPTSFKDALDENVDKVSDDLAYTSDLFVLPVQFFQIVQTQK